MATEHSMYEGVIFFRNGDVGWNESHHLKASTYATARTAMLKIIGYRRVLSPATVEVVYASIRKLGSPRDGLPVVLSYPLPGTASTVVADVLDEVGSPHDAILFRAAAIVGSGDSEQALSVSGYIRGLPDDVVQENKITLPDGTPLSVTITSPEPSGLVAPATYAVAVGDYLAVLKGQTRYAKRLPDTSGTPPTLNFTAEDFTELVFRGKTQKKCGRPFTQQPGRAAAR